MPPPPTPLRAGCWCHKVPSPTAPPGPRSAPPRGGSLGRPAAPPAHARPGAPAAAAAADDDAPASSDDPLASDLARFLLTNPSLAPPATSPSPLLSPSQVARAVVEALARPDYPSPGAGLDTAFAFTLPADTAPAAPVSAGGGRKGRAWVATEAWYGRAEWVDAVLGDHPASLLVGGAGEVGWPGPAEITGRAGRHAIVPLAVSSGGRTYPLTLCLTRVDEAGPWRGAFLVSGLRAGDYTL